VNGSLQINLSSRRIEKTQIILAKIFPWDTQIKACSAPNRLISLGCCEHVEAVFNKETHPSNISSRRDGTHSGCISPDYQRCFEPYRLRHHRQLRSSWSSNRAPSTALDDH